MSKRISSLTIMFPFLNDWGTVGSLVSLAIATAKEFTDDWEVVIVNDGSKGEDREALELIIETINSQQKLKAQSAKFKSKFKVQSENKIHIIDHEKNKGYGGALRSGFEKATKDYIFYTDCDAQYDPRELSNLVEGLSPTISMVNGYKIKRNDPIHRIFMGRIYHYLVKFFFQLPIRDTDCDFRLIRREVFKKVKLFETTGTICVELVKKIDFHGYKIKDVPVHHYWRTSGKSQFFNFRRLYKTGTNLLKLWWKLMVRKKYYR